MADIAEMWRDVHVHGAYSIADTWMAATICRRPKLPGLYWERALFFIRLFWKKKPGNLGRSRIVAAPFCKIVDGGYYIAEMQMDADIIYHIPYVICIISYLIYNI